MDKDLVKDIKDLGHRLHIKYDNKHYMRLEDANGNQCRISLQPSCDRGRVNIGSEKGVNLCISYG